MPIGYRLLLLNSLRLILSYVSSYSNMALAKLHNWNDSCLLLCMSLLILSDFILISFVFSHISSIKLIAYEFSIYEPAICHSIRSNLSTISISLKYFFLALLNIFAYVITFMINYAVFQVPLVLSLFRYKLSFKKYPINLIVSSLI